MHSGWCRHVGWWHCSRKSNSVVKLFGGRVHSGWCRHIGWWHCSRKSNSVVKLFGGRGAIGDGVVKLVGVAPRRFNEVKNLCFDRCTLEWWFVSGNGERVRYFKA